MYWEFDILILHGVDVRGRCYKNRLFALSQIVSKDFGYIKLVETARTADEKLTLLEKMKRENREGVVFKHLDAPYTAGRPASGGTQFKHKFYATASFIVSLLPRSTPSENTTSALRPLWFFIS